MNGLVVARQGRPGQTTYLPGSVLGVRVVGPLNPEHDYGVRGWKVSILTAAGWEQLAGWQTVDAERRAREFARELVDQLTSDDMPSVEYREPTRPK